MARLALVQYLMSESDPNLSERGATRAILPNSVRRMPTYTLLVAACVLWPLATITAQASTASPLEHAVDPAIKPGDDFFAYANGAWLKATTIPAGMERWGARNEIDDIVRLRIATLLEVATRAPLGSSARKVADFRAAYLNESAIEAKGLAPLRPTFDSIDQIADKAALTRTLGRTMRADVDPLNWGVFQSSSLLGLSVEESIHGEKQYVAFLVQGGLGLPDRENYLGSAPRLAELRTRYRQYVGRLLSLAGFDRGDERGAAVVALETAIAQTQGTRVTSANDHNADNVWTRADFARRAPGIDWSTFFAAAGLAKQESFVAWQPTAVIGVASLVASQSLPVWQDYLRVRAIEASADVLPRAFAEEAAMMRAAVTGLRQPGRAERALAATQLAMSDAIGRLYSEQYFPAEQKARVQGLVANVAAAFARRAQAATWMAPATKAIALKKLKRLYVGIGYPDRWQNYVDLRVNPADAFGNAQRIADRNYHLALARLGRQIDMREWWIAPQTVGAILTFQLHSYTFSAALLQAPKFDPTASDAANYGAIGALIGHDISHFVDVLGADYDVDGAMRYWWPAADSARFEALAAPLVSQFSEYRPLPDARVNGKASASENIADLAGLGAAFDAYRRTLGNKINDKEFVRQQDREFFLGFAQSWRAKLSELAMRTQVGSDHAPEMYRVSTVRNFAAWYDAFDVRPGQRLYLEPSARVRVW